MTKEEIHKAICGESKPKVRDMTIAQADSDVTCRIMQAIIDSHDVSVAFRDISKILGENCSAGMNAEIIGMLKHPVGICCEALTAEGRFYFHGFAFNSKGYVVYRLLFTGNGVGILLDRDPEEAVVKWCADRPCAAESIVAITKEITAKYKEISRSRTLKTFCFSDPATLATLIYEEFESFKSEQKGE